MSSVLEAKVGPPPELPESLRTFMAQPEKPKSAIQKCSYSHDAMIDMIVANPWINQGELAGNFGYTEGWVSQVIASDAFQARLAQRKNELLDPYLKATIEERYRGLIVQSLDKLRQKLEQPAAKISDDTLLRAAELGAKALGYGAKSQQNVQNVSFVVQVPPKATNGDTWMAEHSPSAQRKALDVTTVEALPPAAGPYGQEAHKERVDTVPGTPESAGRGVDAMLGELMK